MSDPAMPPTAPPASREPVFTAPPVTVALCLTLLAVFGIIQILPEAWQWAILHDLSVVPSRLVRALDDPLSEAGFWSVAALIGHEGSAHEIAAAHDQTDRGAVLRHIGHLCSEPRDHIMVVTVALGALQRLAGEFDQKSLRAQGGLRRIAA